MTNRWEDVERLFVELGAEDLRETGELRPVLVAFCGDRLRFVAGVRPFAKGRYAKPLIELFALAAPLDADRLALSVSGRVWSLDDPIPPVTAGADLRQRALIINLVDGARGRVRSVSVIHPFELVAGEVTWQEPTRLDGGEGWIFAAMESAIRGRHRLRTSDEEIRRQAARVSRLGHELYLPPDMCARLAPDADLV